MKPESLFSLSEHLDRLSEDGDPLEVLDATVDFEYFRSWTPARTMFLNTMIFKKYRFDLMGGNFLYFCG